MQRVETKVWQRFGFGGPPRPWEHDAHRDLDRLATSYFLDIVQSRQAIRSRGALSAHLPRVEELYTSATQHKHEIDYSLRHPATPAERARVEDRLGALMRIGLALRALLDGEGSPDATPTPAPEPMPAA